MNLLLRRMWISDRSAMGQLYIENIHECYTLEDVPREGVKIYGQTAIPTGRYRIVIDWSNRFQRLMPHLLDVPNFTGIRIHAGNTEKDTSGCILVGQERGIDRLIDSRKAFDALMAKMLIPWTTEEEIWIEVGNG